MEPEFAKFAENVLKELDAQVKEIQALASGSRPRSLVVALDDDMTPVRDAGVCLRFFNGTVAVFTTHQHAMKVASDFAANLERGMVVLPVGEWAKRRETVLKRVRADVQQTLDSVRNVQ